MAGMITREADYAIRAMVFLAGTKQGLAMSTDLLATEVDIPYQFLRRIVLKLTAAGLLKSTRGKGGGITLARDPARITLMDALSAIDPGNTSLNECMLDPRFCGRSVDCVVHKELGTVQGVLNRELSAITFAALSKKNKQQHKGAKQHDYTGN